MTKIIRKAFQGTIPENKILDTYSTSRTDAYSCNKVNQLISKCEILRGTYNIITAPRNMGSGTNTTLEQRYNFKEQLDAIYPEVSGFTRKYYLICDHNTSDTTFTLKIGGVQLMSTSVWGANDDKHMRTLKEDVTTQIKSLSTGHINVAGTTTGWARLNAAYLLVVDIPN